MNILDRIIASKETEVAANKKAVSVSSLEKSPFFNRPVISFSAAVMNPGLRGIVAEYKRKSPSKGSINEEARVEDVTAAYASGGASAISVLTDGPFFGGSLEDLRRVRALGLPLLRKDFMIDEYQLLEARAGGADVILLIAACLTPASVQRLARQAKSLGLEVLLELHNQEELQHLCDEVDVVGINNRDLKTFTVDINRSIELSAALPAHLPRIAESGIRDVDTVLTMRAAGFNGFLIGEQFMKEKDPGAAFSGFISQLAKKGI